METPTNNTAEKEIISIFRSSSKILRSPVDTPRSAVVTHDVVPDKDTPTPRETGTEIVAEKIETTHSSPRQEFILKMKISEEEALGKCKKALRRIRQAISRQRNISMDVQNNVTELEELLDVIGQYRRNWKTAEKERETSLIKTANEENLRLEKPLATHKKRTASSPADINPGKKAKEKKSNEKSNKLALPKDKTVDTNQPKKQKEIPSKMNMQKRPRKRAEAVIIKPREGHSYADVLKTLRQNVKPEEADVAIRSISKTKTGAILLVMGKGGEKNKFCDAIKGTLRGAAEIVDLKPKATIEIQDLDSLSTADEVIHAVNKATDTTQGDINVHLTALNQREQRRAFVTLPVVGAEKILETARIKIGMTNCRIRYREEVKRCFRCFDTGHMQYDCKGPDRKSMGICIRCGEKGHKLKECKNAPRCCVCSQEGKSPVNHLPGSRICISARTKHNL